MANVLIIERMAVSLFKHTLNGEQAAMDNNPNLTSFLEVSSGIEFFDFKTTNGAPLVKNQRIKPSEISIVDTFGGTGTFTGYTAALPIWNKLAELNYFVGYGIEGAAASQAFKNLTDIFPNGSFFGQNGKVYTVNESLQRLEATAFYNKRLFSELDDVATGTLDSGMAGKILQISIVSGQPKITLTNLPGLSDSQKQTYRIRFSSTDAPDRATVLSLLQAYTASPFDAGIIPNDMGGILVETYDIGDDSTVAIYELTGISAGSSLSTLIDDNLIKLGTGSPYPIQDVLEAGNTATGIGLNFLDSGKEVNIGATKVSASDTLGNASEFDANKITVLNTDTGINTKMYNDRIEYFDGNTTTEVYEPTTQDNIHTKPNKSGTYAMLSDIVTDSLKELFAGKNLFDKDAVTLGFYIGGGVPVADPDFGISDFIEVEENTDYYNNNSGLGTYFYDSSKTSIGSTVSSSFTTPSGTAFVRFTVLPAQVGTYQFEQSSIQTRYEPYKYSYRGLFAERNNSRWKYGSGSFLGDSITYGLGLATREEAYPAVAANILGLDRLNNYGVSSSCVAKYPDKTDSFVERSTTLEPDTDFVVIFGGSNDFRTGIPLGDLDSTDEFEFIPALKKTIQNIYFNVGTQTTIFLIAPLVDNESSFSIDYVNSAGLKLVDYIDAIYKVASRFGIPVLDLYNNSGINADNYLEWTFDGLHPNELGHIKLGKQVAAYLDNDGFTRGSFFNADGYIPLTGTLPSAPITGNLYFEGRIGIVREQEDESTGYLQFPDSGGIQMGGLQIIDEDTSYEYYIQIRGDKILVISDNPDFEGITGGRDFSENYLPESYVQKLYVDNISKNFLSSESTLDLEVPFPARVMYYTYTGASAAIWTLPPISGNTKVRFILINTGSASVTINSNTGGNDIWDSGSLQDSIALPVGSSMEIYNNSQYYIIL